MSRATICDHCHKPITKDDDSVRIDVWERKLLHMADLKKEAVDQVAGLLSTPSLSIGIDLHHYCYLASLYPAIKIFSS